MRASGSNCSCAIWAKCGSISTVTTAPARSARRTVSEPVPVPTSSTTSCGLHVGRAHEQVEQIQVDQKILAVLGVGLKADFLKFAAEERDGLFVRCHVGCLPRSSGPRSSGELSNCRRTYFASRSVSTLTVRAG